MSETEKYEFSTKIRDVEVKYRKWKVKDKKKFINSDGNKKELREALVYDCIEDKKIALSEDEFKFLLIKIRETSLEDKVEYNFQCDKCSEEFHFVADLNEIMTAEYKPYDEIVVKNHIFKMGELKNREFYEDAMAIAESIDEKNLLDFILHIEAYNDGDGYTFNQLNDIINELDADVFEKIFLQWEEMRFKLNSVYEVICPHCNHGTYYEFDDMPGFFPASWDQQ